MYLLIYGEWEQCIVASARTIQFLNQAHLPMVGGVHLVSQNCFCADLYMCVCQPPRLLLTSGMMWREMDPIKLVKQLLQLSYSNCSCYHYWVWPLLWYIL